MFIVWSPLAIRLSVVLPWLLSIDLSSELSFRSEEPSMLPERSGLLYGEGGRRGWEIRMRRINKYANLKGIGN